MKSYTTERLSSSGSPLYRVTAIEADGSELLFDVATDNTTNLDKIIKTTYAAIKNPAPPKLPGYIEKRRAAYPPIEDYLDGIVKNDRTQIDAYIAACKAVKAKYPKE